MMGFTGEAVRVKMELDTLNRLILDTDTLTIERRGRDGTTKSWKCTVHDEDGESVARARGASMRQAVRNCAQVIIQALRR